MCLMKRICDSLDNIPLAIEIAAGQLKRFALERILRAADTPLDLWQSKAQRKAGRQQTLRRTLDWSYDLLDPTSRQVLALLSVFSGPFAEDQGLAVCAEQIEDEVDVLDSIEELIDSSFLSAHVEGKRRISMLQTVQAFGREKLKKAGLTRQVEHRHGQVMAARCRELGARFAGERERDAAAAILADLSNIRSALERALPQDLRLATAIVGPLFMFGYFHRGSETSAWPGRIMARPGADALPEAPMLLAAAAGHMFHDRGDPDAARALIDRGFVLEASGGKSSRGWLPHVAGQIAFWSREPAKFISCHLRAIAQARKEGDLACEIIDMAMAALVKARMGDLDGARALIEALSRAEPLVSQPSLIGYIYFAKGGVTRFEDPERAIEQLETSVEWAKIAGNLLGIQRINGMASAIKAKQVPPEKALVNEIEALMALPEHGATFYVWTCISRLLSLLFTLGADTQLAVIAGALQGSPLKLGKTAQKSSERGRGWVPQHSIGRRRAGARSRFSKCAHTCWRWCKIWRFDEGPAIFRVRF
jgi:hypothetical protein